MKVILEVDKTPTSSLLHNGPVHKCLNMPRLCFTEEEFQDLPKYDPDEKANADYDAGYAEGLNDAWEVAGIIYNRDDVLSAFKMCRADIFNTLSPAEAISKTREYTAKKTIRVGDELESIDTGAICVAVKINDNYRHLEVFGDNGVDFGLNPEKFRKTGRHFPQIVEALKQMEDRGNMRGELPEGDK